MGYKILVTGGAGFIGSFLVDELVKEHDVTVLDNLAPQVHREGRKPGYLNPRADFVKGDVGDDAFGELLRDHEIVYHQAAAVGVGQSMYQVRDYVGDNTYATSNLLQALVEEDHGVRKLVVASSMSIYGEGKYECEECGIVYPNLRSNEQLKTKEWEMRCPSCGRELRPLPTDEDKPLHPTSIYAVTKRDQEEMCLVIGKAYGIPTVALRYFNVHGPRQALSNPYTGVCAVFSSRIRNDNPPVIYEDGLQTRDFVSVHDVVQANLLALKQRADYGVFNVGTGEPISIRGIADVLIELYGKDLKPTIAGKFREGDIRHCYSDISRIKRLGYEPRVKFSEGIRELADWVNSLPREEVLDFFDEAQAELVKRRLLMG
ncbi:MAG: NAD-dependent epimerase/dehydratase family protein [Candidatus Hydrothermarchaeaceae archaeon]